MENLISLVQAAQVNDRDAIEALYSEYSKPVYSIALKLTDDVNDAEIITQDVFVDAFRKIGDLEKPEIFADELKRITSSKCNDFFRYSESKKMLKSEVADEIDRSFAPDKPIEDIEIPSDILPNVFEQLDQDPSTDAPPVFKTSAPSEATTEAAAESPKEKPAIFTNRVKRIIITASIAGVLLIAGVTGSIFFMEKNSVDNAGNGGSNEGGKDTEAVIIDDESNDYELDGFTREAIYEGDAVVIDTDRIPHIHMGEANLTDEMLAQYLSDGTIPPDTNDLSLESNQISDISSLSALSDMDWLSIQNNNVSDISVLSGFANLRVLWAQNNNISDITPLLGLKNLNELILYGNPISDTQKDELRAALPECNLIFSEE